MSARLTLTLPFPPSSNRYWRAAPGRGLVRSAQADSYITHVAALFRIHRWSGLAGELTVERLHVFFPRRSGDLGNRWKVLEDALNGYAWLDDNQIGKYRDIERRYDEPRRPRVELTVSGERFATPEELAAERLKKAEANRKRKATIARNRALKPAGGGLQRRGRRVGFTATSASYAAGRAP